MSHEVSLGPKKHTEFDLDFFFSLSVLERFTKVYLLFLSYINDPRRAFLHSECGDLYGCWTD